MIRRSFAGLAFVLLQLLLVMTYSHLLSQINEVQNNTPERTLIIVSDLAPLNADAIIIYITKYIFLNEHAVRIPTGQANVSFLHAESGSSVCHT